ncbi:acyltransferase family protein [Sphingomonas sp. NPDC079357]|uniref:acyltransferase family protein n=1 Tax=Sphingomonas sp. NPDC079357 TaxID=3364518 RepID=UPI00384BD3FB
MNSDDRLPIATQQPSDHFALLQILRGVAALWVVFFHMYTLRLIQPFYDELPAILQRLVFDYGRGGVAVFFVLSGFVITHSLWNKPVDGRYARGFMMRRIIRLDPAYWASIAVAYASAAIIAAAHGNVFEGPTLRMLILHFFYLQELIPTEQIQYVYWTLTYEVQFYLLTLLGAWAWCRARGRMTGWRRAVLAIPTIFVATAIVSAMGDHDVTIHGLFLNYWFAFVMGGLAYVAGWRRGGWLSLASLAILIMITLARAPLTEQVFNTPAAFTAILLYAGARFNFLRIGASSTILNGLGKISYSLYLVHVPIMMISGGLVTRMADNGTPSHVLQFAIQTALCVSGATLFWFFIEAPTHRLAQRYGRSRQSAQQPQPA